MASPDSALLIVDVQRDFRPTGALPVPRGDEVVSVINDLRERATFPCGVFQSKDWHPSAHISFCTTHDAPPFTSIMLPDGTSQTLWPPHCVQGSPGAELADGLVVLESDTIILKGMDEKYDSYSAFFDNLKKKQTDLDEKLKNAQVKTLYVCGLALDVCVLFTALDAVELGYRTVLLEDACRGLSPSGNEKAIARMKDAGVIISTTSQLG